MDILANTLGLSSPQELLALSKTGLRILLILLVAGLLMKLARKLIIALKSHMKEQAADNLEETKRIDTLGRVVRYIATVVIGVVAAVEILNEFGISIAPILTAAGVVGVAVGFGAQSLIKDYFTGFFILLENQIRQGDVVEISDKAGLVEEVTLRYIKMRDYSGNVHYVPNGSITTVTNMSRGYAQSVIDVGVAYREDLQEVMQIMTVVGQKLRADEEYGIKILDEMEMAGVDQLADSAVIIRCRFKVLPLEQWGVRREYLKRIKQAFDQHGIEIPYPHLTLYPGEFKDRSSPVFKVANS